MIQGIYERLDWLTNKVKKLCCAIEQIQQSGAGSYKVYTALLTQSGGDGPLGNCSDDPQPLVIGVTYQIFSNDGTADFTNVGAPNNNIGTYFVATGTTPNNWGTPGDVCLDYNTGAPVVTVLENTIGNVWFEYFGIGTYGANSNGLFTLNKSICIAMPNQYVESPGDLYNFQTYVSATTQCVLNTFYNYAPQDGILNGFAQTSIEIRVYN